MDLGASLTIVADHEAWLDAASQMVVDAAHDAIGERGRFVFGLSGGSTPTALYERLAQSDQAGRIDWSSVVIVFGDERCVPPDAPASNYAMARRALLDHVPIPSAQVHRMEGELAPARAAQRYHEVLVALDPNPSKPPSIDLLLLGLGDNAHTASLFPGLSWRARLDELVIDEYVEVQQQWRLTVTPLLITAARSVLFLVEGTAKAAPVAAVLNGTLDQVQAPARAVLEGTPTRWLLDEAAASELDR